MDKIFANAGSPPRAKKIENAVSHFDDLRHDEYSWLNDKTNPEVLELLHEENVYMKAVTAPLKDSTELLFEEIKGRIKETDLSVPVRKGDYEYLTRTQEGLQYPVHLRTKIGSDEEELLIDENALAGDSDFFSLGGLSVSPNAERMVFLSDNDGSEIYSLTVQEIQGERRVLHRLENCYYGLAWALNSSYVFYVKADAQMRPYQVWILDLESGSTKPIFTEDDESFYVGIGTTKDDRFVVIEAGSKNTNQSFLIDAEEPQQEPVAFTARITDLEYSIEHHGESFFVVTNRDDSNFTLMSVRQDVNNHTKWQPYLHPAEGVRLLGIEVFETHIALLERDLAVTRLRVLDLESQTQFEIPKSESVSTIYIGSNEEFNSHVLRYEYTSMITPRQVLEIDLRTRDVKMLKQSEVIGDFESSGYKSFRVWAEAGDGTKIPVSVVCRADIEAGNGGNPTLVYGYGSYEHSIDPTFSSARLSLLDRGVVFAIAHVRGGGEMGRTWYLRGKTEQKMNTFTDFIDATTELVRLGWADPSKIAARGGSAGGMLMGAVTNLSPSLWKVIIAEVPFVDCLTTIMDPSLPLTTFEWEEWGNPIRDRGIYNLMKAYSPYENIAPVQYPIIFATAGLNDPRVSYWEPAKWVQRIRDVTTNPKVILKTEMGAGHQGPSGRYDAWRDEAAIYAFLLEALGIT